MSRVIIAMMLAALTAQAMPARATPMRLADEEESRSGKVGNSDKDTQKAAKTEDAKTDNAEVEDTKAKDATDDDRDSEQDDEAGDDRGDDVDDAEARPQMRELSWSYREDDWVARNIFWRDMSYNDWTHELKESDANREVRAFDDHDMRRMQRWVMDRSDWSNHGLHLSYGVRASMSGYDFDERNIVWSYRQHRIGPANHDIDAPEPAATGLLALGLGLYAWRRRFRRRHGSG